MIYETCTDTDPTPRQIEAASSKWAARKWARLYHDGSLQDHRPRPPAGRPVHIVVGLA